MSNLIVDEDDDFITLEDDEDSFDFSDDPEEGSDEVAKTPWLVLVADDDVEVHSVTKLVLSGTMYQGRPLEILSTYSGAETIDVLKKNPNVALLLLDVVMESEDSGLITVRRIREELKNHQIRIILRTGQPGQAPEREVILNCEIDDYKAKTEITDQKLFTATIAALRSYEYIMEIEQGRKTLENRVEERTKELAQASMKAEEAARAKAAFLAMMSHEIRTPMNGVLGMIDLLLRSPLNAQQKEQAEIVKSSGQGLLAILNDILDFSKLEAGRLSLEIIHFDLSKLISGLVKLMESNALKKGLHIDFFLEDDLPKVLVGDPTRLRQVLLNYLSNAIKFTEKGKVTIRVSSQENKRFCCEEDQSPKKCICFSIIDTGIGISSTTQKTLFQEFTQADSSITRKFGGTGLGLAICQKIAELMGGHVGVESEEGVGSHFWITVPLSEGDPNLIIQLNDLSHQKHTLSTHKILLAEDNEVNQKVAIGMLNELGQDYDIVCNGEEAFQAVQKTEYDLVLMDMQMPVIDGLAATKMIRQLGGSYMHLPIIALTANAQAQDVQTCLEAGMDAHLAKPLTLNALSEVFFSHLPNVTSVKESSSKAENKSEKKDGLSFETELVLDFSRLKELEHTLGRDFVEELAQETLPDLKNMSQALIASIEACDIIKGRSQAHDLKAVSANFGFSQLRRQAAEIEMACREGKKEKAYELCGPLPNIIENSVEVFKESYSDIYISF